MIENTDDPLNNKQRDAIYLIATSDFTRDFVRTFQEVVKKIGIESCKTENECRIRACEILASGEVTEPLAIKLLQKMAERKDEMPEV